MKFHSKKVNGKFIFSGSKKWMQMRLAELPDDVEYSWEVKRYKKDRSNLQNRYYWGCVVQLVYEGLRDAGFDEIRNPENAHEMLKEMFFKKIIFSEQKGELAMIQSSAQFSTGEFEEKMESIRMWAKDFLGITVPLPNEQLQIL